MTADQIADTRTEAEKLTDALVKTLNGVAISRSREGDQFPFKSLADLTDTAKENGHSLDVTSEKGRKVKSAFLDAAQAAMAHAEATRRAAEQRRGRQCGAGAGHRTASSADETGALLN
jgi:hypothetical protein